MLVDGSGTEPRRADVRIEGDRIAEISAANSTGERDANALPETVVEGRGLALSPGFIDMHAHSDLALVADKQHVAKISQGVTTEVVGQDGIGYAPITDEWLPTIRSQIAGWNGHPEFPIDWRSMSSYLEVLAKGTATNVAVLVPQGNLRMFTVGYEDRPASSREISQMKGLLTDSLDAGAVGMSSGLTYAPGMFADTGELIELCKVVALHGGYYAPHTRSYGGGALGAYAEAIEIAKRSGCALHLTHATLNFTSNRGKAAEFLEMVDRARSDGVSLSLDTYPYLPGATTLAALLPSWLAAGGPDAMLLKLRKVLEERDVSIDHDSVRARLLESLNLTGSDGFHGELANWSAIQISGVSNPALASLVGRTIDEVATEEGEDPVDTVCRILIEDEMATGILMHVGNEENVQAIMRHPSHCGGSDGILTGNRPHPRAWGTFPRYLSHYVRDLGVLGLAECVRHLTYNPAKRLGLHDRGLVREGYFADLVLFNPDLVRDEATFENPRQPATGIEAVFVNGELAWWDGKRTPSVSGQVLGGRF